jgi:hypothetical protein
MDFWSAYMQNHNNQAFRPMNLLKLPLTELPQARLQQNRLLLTPKLMSLQIVFTLRAVQQPSSIPVSLASLHLVQRSSILFMDSLRTLLDQTGSLSERMSALRGLYEAGNVANQIVDGNVPFPENEQSICDGISLEFRYFCLFVGSSPVILNRQP